MESINWLIMATTASKGLLTIAWIILIIIGCKIVETTVLMALTSQSTKTFPVNFKDRVLKQINISITIVICIIINSGILLYNTSQVFTIASVKHL